jgi:hypothetical protein
VWIDDGPDRLGLLTIETPRIDVGNGESLPGQTTWRVTTRLTHAEAAWSVASGSATRVRMVALDGTEFSGVAYVTTVGEDDDLRYPLKAHLVGDGRLHVQPKDDRGGG